MLLSFFIIKSNALLCYLHHCFICDDRAFTGSIAHYFKQI